MKRAYAMPHAPPLSHLSKLKHSLIPKQGYKERKTKRVIFALFRFKFEHNETVYCLISLSLATPCTGHFFSLLNLLITIMIFLKRDIIFFTSFTSLLLHVND